GAANNLLAAMIDNHIYQGNELGIDPERITWKRCVDMNDRQLRVIRDGLGGSTNGVPRSDGYDITVASEIMAVFCLAKSLSDLKTRLARIIIGYNFDGNPVTAGDLGAVGAMAALLKDAIKPNLVQTLEGTPAIIHGGPFANIAHGCNSLIATETALKLADYTVTEAGFGADLGAQKFFDIKCRQSGLAPNAVVLVATIRALKMHGGVEKTKLNEENISALKCGLENLYKHFENITKVYKLPCIVALNHFYNDLESEVGVVKSECLNKQIPIAISKAWELGGAGAIELAEEVVKLCEQDSNFTLCYENSLTIDQKILAVAKRIYGADGIDVLDNAKEQIAKLTDLGFGNLPVCIAKTQYSFSDKPELLGAPKNFNLTIKDIKVSAGAGFIVVLTGNILTMPGLPKEPAAKRIDIDEKGKISGLF
ncbi:MAG: formate--tetrahydrofolate ligase, partial [Clostridia bacterium]|nr:formate--tetrahydrofolate ligase [Clostridia bacterium]